MQMLMGSMTPNNGTTGFQPWMMPGMNAATPGTAQTPAAFDPAAFNAMMMSQMMGSMDMMGGANNPNSDR